jgi:uncharacterized protein YecE (DUF72 family)
MSLPRSLYCGPSGWSYPHWNGIVYPRLKRPGFHALEYLSTYFNAVEINTSFYQSIRPELASLWVKKVEHNPKFLFTVKLGRKFTHERSLAAAEIAHFKDGLRADAVSLGLPLYRGEPRVPDRAAAGLS